MQEDRVASELEAVRRRERRAAAVARTAARVASERSLPATLRALAHEILQTDDLAGVQVLTSESSGDKLRMLGAAGFPASQNRTFFDRLMECQARGAHLTMLDALSTGDPVVIPHRYRVVMNDPAWEPLHDYHRYPEWDAFASIPIRVRNTTIGILNAYIAPGRKVDRESLDFLFAMAEQAGLAIDYASLLAHEREAAQRDVRQQLARDLHDSAVQRVFSIGMLVQTLKVLNSTDESKTGKRIQDITLDLEELAESVSKDLRGLVAQLRPSATQGLGLREALSTLTANTHRQTGINFSMNIGSIAEELEADLAEDVYHVIAEATHNAVKHSSADLITIALDDDDAGTGAHAVQLTVRDNGHADPDRAPLVEGNGLSFMRERVRRWQGQLTISQDSGEAGTVISAEIPLY
ncbi:GAF domain-containing sensor histidine kinase [Neomicrococcus lactis]